MSWSNTVARSETLAWWASVNPVLPKGGIAVESDTGRTKLGDGRSTWSTLDYVGSDNLVARVAALEAAVAASTDSAVLAMTEAAIASNGYLTFEWAEHTDDWEQWEQPSWLTLGGPSNPDQFTFTETGLYLAHVLFIIVVVDPVPASAVPYYLRIGPADSGYISEAWVIDQQVMTPLGGGNNAFGLGATMVFQVVEGPGDDASHRVGVEVNDPAIVRVDLQGWSNGAKTPSVVGGTVAIHRVRR